MKLIIDLIANIILSTSEVYVWHNISNKKFLVKNISNIAKIILLSIIIVLLYYFANNYIKGLLSLVLAIIFCKNIMRINMKKSIILTLISQLIIIISEGLIILFMKLIFNLSTEFISTTQYMVVLVNLFVSLFSILLSRDKWIKMLYVKLINITNSIHLPQLLIFILFIMLGSNIYTTSVYFNDNVVIKLILNTAVSIIYTVIVILVFNYQSKYNRINYKYQKSLEDLQIQELLINDYRIMNHENKNQLLTIKTLTKNKKVIEYIDSIINIKKKSANKIIKDALRLPQGGIRGLIYNKLILMKENNINYHISVDKKITHKNFQKISNDDLVSICNIIGVFLDNAIEESSNIRDNLINITFYMNDSFINIIISNKHTQNFKKIKTLRTNKGKGRGYGLQLVKNIVESNNRLKNETEISKDIFTQKLLIKI